eukprot:GHVT01049597.1.p1 GENE.GHVT01049597.1~~GHVT01049597.1.p1  ORF type:complete len:572 (+),score=69.90 GHVT01049597.1:213-1928(+)
MIVETPPIVLLPLLLNLQKAAMIMSLQRTSPKRTSPKRNKPEKKKSWTKKAQRKKDKEEKAKAKQAEEEEAQRVIDQKEKDRKAQLEKSKERKERKQEEKDRKEEARIKEEQKNIAQKAQARKDQARREKEQEENDQREKDRIAEEKKKQAEITLAKNKKAQEEAQSEKAQKEQAEKEKAEKDQREQARREQIEKEKAEFREKNEKQKEITRAENRKFLEKAQKEQAERERAQRERDRIEAQTKEASKNKTETAKSETSNSTTDSGSTDVPAIDSTQNEAKKFGSKSLLLPDGTSGIPNKNKLYLANSNKMPDGTKPPFPPLPDLVTGHTFQNVANQYKSKLPPRAGCPPMPFSQDRKVYLEDKIEDWEPMCGDNDRWWDKTLDDPFKEIFPNPMFVVVKEIIDKTFFDYPGRLLLFGENERDGSVKFQDGAITWTTRVGSRDAIGGIADACKHDDEWYYNQDSRAIGLITQATSTIFNAGLDKFKMYLDSLLYQAKMALSNGYTWSVAGVLPIQYQKVEKSLGYVPQCGFGTGSFLGTVDGEKLALIHLMVTKLERLAREECVKRGYLSK